MLAVAATWILIVDSLYLATFVIGGKALGGMGQFLTYAILGAHVFGVIPSILLGSALCALYHTGYGMPWSEMLFLFGIGIMFAVIFRVTRSVFILQPLFQPFGQLMTLVRDRLSLPWAVALGFVDALALMITVVVVFGRKGKKLGFAP